MKIKTIFVASIVCFNLFSGVSFAQFPIYEPSKGKMIAASLVYPYYQDSLYVVNVGLNRVTDIQLGTGEIFIKAVGGDTSQWMIDTATIAGISHVYIKPLYQNANTNIVINTDRRSYRLLVSVKSTYDSLIIFDFFEENAKLEKARQLAKAKQEVNTKKNTNDETIDIKYLNYKYTTKANKGMDETLCPKKVFDDGLKTYIEMPENRYDLPVLYDVDDMNKKKLTLVNYRIKGKYYVADKVFNHARLQYSNKLFVDIYPEKEGEKD